jgi:hypothetical protein
VRGCSLELGVPVAGHGSWEGWIDEIRAAFQQYLHSKVTTRLDYAKMWSVWGNIENKV